MRAIDAHGEAAARRKADVQECRAGRLEEAIDGLIERRSADHDRIDDLLLG